MLSIDFWKTGLNYILIECQFYVIFFQYIYKINKIVHLKIYLRFTISKLNYFLNKC